MNVESDRVAERRAELADRFSRVQANGEQTAVIEAVDALFWSLAEKVDRLVPDGREKALALTSLEQAAMWAVKAASRG